MKGFFSKHKGNNFADNRTYIEGELAIKPYYYFRNGHLHVRYNVDRAIELSEAEALKLKNDMTANPADKQSVLAEAWSFFEKKQNEYDAGEKVVIGEPLTLEAEDGLSIIVVVLVFILVLVNVMR